MKDLVLFALWYTPLLFFMIALGTSPVEWGGIIAYYNKPIISFLTLYYFL